MAAPLSKSDNAPAYARRTARRRNQKPRICRKGATVGTTDKWTPKGLFPRRRRSSVYPGKTRPFPFFKAPKTKAPSCTRRSPNLLPYESGSAYAARGLLINLRFGDYSLAHRHRKTQAASPFAPDPVNGFMKSLCVDHHAAPSAHDIAIQLGQPPIPFDDFREACRTPILPPPCRNVLRAKGPAHFGSPSR